MVEYGRQHVRGLGNNREMIMSEETSQTWPAAWRSPLRVTAIFFAVLIVLLFLWSARSIFVTTFLGLLLGVSIMPAVDRLQRFRIPRGLAAAAIVLTLMAILAGIVALLGPVLQTQGRELRVRIPEAVDRINGELARRHIGLGALAGDAGKGSETASAEIVAKTADSDARNVSPSLSTAPAKSAAAAVAEAGTLSALLRKQLANAIPYLFPFFSTTVSALTGILLVIFLAIFFAADPEIYLRGVLHLVPGPHRRRMGGLLRSLGNTLRAWVVARSIAMATIGVVVGVAMAILGVRAAVALGVIAGLLEFVPVFGPIVGAIPAIALAFLDSPQKALWVFLTFVILQQLEGNVLIPMLLQKAVEVPPALSLIGIASLGLVLGILGVFIAEPLVAAMLVIVKVLYVEPSTDEGTGGEPVLVSG
jgi:predicted PurR-regulated permease PerM